MRLAIVTYFMQSAVRDAYK